MSKYDPLWQYLQVNDESGYVLTFAEVEKILGFKIDHAFLTYKKKLKDFGYAVQKISMKNQTVSFTKI